MGNGWTKLILEDIINEINANDAYTRFYSDIPQEDFNKVVGNNKNIDKFIQFLLNAIKNKETDADECVEFREKLEKADNVVRQQFLNAFKAGEYKSFIHAYDSLDSLIKTGGVTVKKVAKDGYIKIGNVNGWAISSTATYSANNKYFGPGGLKARWCTASNRDGNFDGYHMFRRYTINSDAVLIQFVNEQNSEKAYQVQVFRNKNTSELCNRDNHITRFDDFINDVGRDTFDYATSDEVLPVLFNLRDKYESIESKLQNSLEKGRESTSLLERRMTQIRNAFQLECDTFNENIIERDTNEFNNLVANLTLDELFYIVRENKLPENIHTDTDFGFDAKSYGGCHFLTIMVHSHPCKIVHTQNMPDEERTRENNYGIEISDESRYADFDLRHNFIFNDDKICDSFKPYGDTSFVVKDADGRRTSLVIFNGTLCSVTNGATNKEIRNFESAVNVGEFTVAKDDNYQDYIINNTDLSLKPAILYASGVVLMESDGGGYDLIHIARQDYNSIFAVKENFSMHLPSSFSKFLNNRLSYRRFRVLEMNGEIYFNSDYNFYNIKTFEPVFDDTEIDIRGIDMNHSADVGGDFISVYNNDVYITYNPQNGYLKHERGAGLANGVPCDSSGWPKKYEADPQYDNRDDNNRDELSPNGEYGILGEMVSKLKRFL